MVTFLRVRRVLTFQNATWTQVWRSCMRTQQVGHMIVCGTGGAAWCVPVQLVFVCFCVNPVDHLISDYVCRLHGQLQELLHAQNGHITVYERLGDSPTVSEHDENALVCTAHVCFVTVSEVLGRRHKRRKHLSLDFGVGIKGAFSSGANIHGDLSRTPPIPLAFARVGAGMCLPDGPCQRLATD